METLEILVVTAFSIFSFGISAYCLWRRRKGGGMKQSSSRENLAAIDEENPA